LIPLLVRKLFERPLLQWILGLGEPPVKRPEARHVYLRPLRFSTGVRGLDGLLGGGVEVGSITELIGEFGAGKTQVCHQLAVMVQLPRGSGGLGARALYVDTEGTFRPERIVQIARHRGLDPEQALENIVYARAYNSDHLAALLRSASEEALRRNIGLVVVDEVSGLPRREEKRSERVRAFHSVVAGLRALAALGVAVVASRQVVFAGDELAPAGGAALDSYAHRSLFLKKRGESLVTVEVIDELGLGRSSSFYITEEGVVDA